MTSLKTTAELASKVRESGFFASLASSQGHASLGLIEVRGRDAASFLHSQVTNEVEGLQRGEGNQSARVTRTGHLVSLFSLHALDVAEASQTFLLMTPRQDRERLVQELDKFLFADDVTFEDVTESYQAIAVCGPRAADWVARSFGEGVKDLAREHVLELQESGTRVVRHPMSGDDGFVILVPQSASDAVETLRTLVRDDGGVILEDPQRGDVLEMLRIEAGVVSIGQDAAPAERLLPETALEQQRVSYTKGCYLGQEVIARVRTYGAPPFALRGLIVETPEGSQPTETLSNLPAAGENIFSADGSKLGVIASRTYSPVRSSVVAYAYLGKAHRTPTHRLRFQGLQGPLDATVTLLPFYHVPDREKRVAHYYDLGIRTFADGREEEAVTHLEESLRLDPSFRDGYEAIGVILGRSGRFHEAIDLFQRLEEVAPEEPMVHTNLSLYYMKIGDKGTAEHHAALATQKTMQKAFAEASGEKKSAAEIAAEQEEAQRRDAERKKGMFAQVLEIDEKDPVALFGLGNAHSTLHEWEEAERVYARACEVDKNNAAVFLARGKCLEALDRHSEAVQCYRAGMDVASRKGDLMPLREMENRMLLLSAKTES